MKVGLIAKNLTRRIGGRDIVRDVSVSIYPGRCTMLLGANGAGKSATMKMIAGVDTWDSGTILLDGRVVDSRSRNQEGSRIWPTVVMVFASPYLWPHLTVADNWRLVSESSATPEVSIAQVKILASELEVEHLVGRRPNQLSRGEQSRVALIRSLAALPRYLLVDEPSANLSISHVNRMGRVLKRCCESGMGLLVSTPLLGFGQAIGDSFIFLENGEIIEIGETSALARPQSSGLRRFLDIAEPQ